MDRMIKPDFGFARAAVETIARDIRSAEMRDEKPKKRKRGRPRKNESRKADNHN